MNAGPCLAHGADFDVDVAQSIVMVSWIFVVDTALEPEARGGYIGHDPVAVPYRVGVLAYGLCTPHQRGVFLVSCWEGGVQLGDNEGVCGESVDVCEREVVGAVEGELDRVARRRTRYWGAVEAAGGALFLARAGVSLLGLRRLAV